jgi:hypothetical protein
MATFTSLRNPQPLFVCEECGWRKVAHVRFTFARQQPDSRYAVEVLGDDEHWDTTMRPHHMFDKINRRVIHDKLRRVSLIRYYCETRWEAELLGRDAHESHIHYRINELEPTDANCN